MPVRRLSLKTGHIYPFVCLQIDIAGHSKLADAERVLHAAKDRFHNQITGIVETYGGEGLGWKGDGGAFLFPVTDGRQYDEATFAAFRILESLPGVNAELQMTTGLGESLAVRTSLDAGTAVYDANPGLITGDFLNAFLKHERAIGRVGTVSITERVHRQISGPLRGRFIGHEASAELGGRIYRSGGSDSKAAAEPAITAQEYVSQYTTPPPEPLAKHGTPSLAQGQVLIERDTLVATLEGLAPSDFAAVVTRIPGAASRISRHGTVAEHAAELVVWAESSKGCGLAAIEKSLASFR